jgi:hypothetical protein
MDKTWAVSGALGAGLFAGSVLLLLPPTHTKTSWTSASYSHPVRIYARPDAEESAPAAQPVAYVAPPAHEAAEQPDDGETPQEIGIADADRAYSDGYAWAADRDAQSSRECRRLTGPGEAGCRDYVASLDPETAEPEQPALN